MNSSERIYKLSIPYTTTCILKKAIWVLSAKLIYLVKPPALCCEEGGFNAFSVGGFITSISSNYFFNDQDSLGSESIHICCHFPTFDSSMCFKQDCLVNLKGESIHLARGSTGNCDLSLSQVLRHYFLCPKYFAILQFSNFFLFHRFCPGISIENT